MSAFTSSRLAFAGPLIAAVGVLGLSGRALGQGQPSEPEPPAVPGAPSESVDEDRSRSLATYAGPVMQEPPDDPRPPTGTEEELAQIRPGVVLKKKFDEIAAETNFKFGMAHTLLFQQASAGPGHRTAAGGDLDFLGKWTAIGAGTKDTGVVAGSVEYRYQIGDITPSQLGGQIGTLLPTTNGFNERPFTIKELYWDQKLFEDRFRYGVGRIDPESLLGGHRLQSANTFFLDKAFSSNPTVAYPGPGIAMAALVRPVEWMYIDAGLTDANGKATAAGIDTFFENLEFFTFAEAGLTPTFEGVGTGRYRVAVWHIDARENDNKPADRGFTVAMDQDLSPTVIAFARYGHADGDVTGVTNSVQAGVGVKNVLGEDNMFGAAAAWSEPFADGLRDEKVVEFFQRFQWTETIQFTLDVEVIFDPSNAPDDDVLGVFSARLRFSF